MIVMEDIKKREVKFVCPKDGKISQDDVAFLCNTCGKNDLIVQNDLFVCPQCLESGSNFQCMLCDSKEVKALVDGEAQDHL